MKNRIGNDSFGKTVNNLYIISTNTFLEKLSYESVSFEVNSKNDYEHENESFGLVSTKISSKSRIR